MYKSSQSLWDSFIQLLPQFNELKVINYNRGRDYVDPTAAKNLFSIWRTAENKVSPKTFRRPSTLAHSDLENMKNEGLVKIFGENIEITEKGSKVIKVMILGDERSSFDDNESIIDYSQALGNSRGVKTAKRTKVASKNDWWARFE